MAKRSEIQAQMDALAEQLASADEDDDYEVWVKNDKGHETRVPSKRAAGWLHENFGISLVDLPAPAAGDDDPDDDPKDPKKPAGGTGFFAAKRK